MTFDDSMESMRGIEGPVRSMSRMPTDWPARDRERASWVVTEDLPTPPLPERTCRTCQLGCLLGEKEDIPAQYV